VDKTHLRDDGRIMGHLFVTFVMLSIRFGIAKMRNDTELLSKYSAIDVPDTYAAMKTFTQNPELKQSVSKEMRGLDARLDLFMYNTQDDPDRLNGVKHRTDKKPFV